MQRNDDEFWTIEVDAEPALVRLIWKAATARMTDAEFRRGLEVCADMALDNDARALWVDLRHFAHAPSPDIGPWRDSEIIPRYNRAGVSKFVYLTAPDFAAPDGGAPEPRPGEDFATRFFASETDAIDWIREP